MCKKCGEALTGQFVRALDGTFHLDCFRCRVSAGLPSLSLSPFRSKVGIRAKSHANRTVVK